MKKDISINTIGFVGLGNMGAPMARSLARSGYEVIGFDISESIRGTLAQEGEIETSADLSKIAMNDAVIFMLPNGNIVRDLLLGSERMIDHLSQNCIVIDMSSSDPEIYQELEPEIEQKGAAIVDAPVSGNVSGAQAGTLTIMAGGDQLAIDRAVPLFKAMGKTIFKSGALGAGQTTKALNNLLSAGGLMLAIEVLLVAKKAGLDPALVNSILNVSTGRNNSTERKIEPFVLSGAYNSGFGLSLMAKDLRTASAIAKRSDTTMPLGEHAIGLVNLAAEELQGVADHTEIAKWLQRKMEASF